MALSLSLPSGLAGWGKLSGRWKTALWVVLFVLLSRLLYLPSAQALAGSERSVIEAPRNTALVLEGVAQPGAPAVTLLFEEFESFTLESPRAGLTAASRSQLAELGARLPLGAGAHALSWNLNLPPGEDALPAPGFLRLEITPAADADLSLGALDGNLVLGSGDELALAPVAQDYVAIGGWLRFDGRSSAAPSDIMPQFRILPAGGESGEARATLAWRAADPEMLLGDPFGADRGLAIRSIAHVDEAGTLLARYCGTSGGGMLLSTIFQPRLEPQPPRSACRPGALRASTIRFDDGAIRVELGGRAFVPGASQLLDKLKDNIVLWPVLAALIAIPGQKVLAALLALFARKEKEGAAA